MKLAGNKCSKGMRLMLAGWARARGEIRSWRQQAGAEAARGGAETCQMNNWLCKDWSTQNFTLTLPLPLPYWLLDVDPRCKCGGGAEA